MKLLKLALLNIQSHEKSLVRFSPYLNAIIGTTDSGKSSILRGIIQLATNKLKWDDLRRWDSKSSVISLSDEKNIIKRVKSSSKNAYVVNGKTLGTVRTDVPDSVFNLLNINEINIQHQKDSWFLIDKSKAHISREINKVAGLSIMDRSIQALNKKIREIKDRIRSDNNHILESENALMEFDWVAKSNVELSVLEKYEEKISNLEEKIEELNGILMNIDKENENLKNLLPESIITEIKSIFEGNEKIELLEDQINELKDILSELSKFKLIMEKVVEIDTTELEDTKEKIKSTEGAIDVIEDILNDLNEEKENNILIEQKIEMINNKLKKIKVCPTCKAPYRLKETEKK